MIELMISLSVISTLIVLGVPAYGSIKSNVILKNEVYGLVNNIREAQNLAQISQDGEKHGVFIESDKYTLYSGESFASAEEKQSFDFVNSIVVYDGIGRDISFERLSGTTASTSIRIGLNPSDSIDVQIDRNGRVEID